MRYYDFMIIAKPPFAKPPFVNSRQESPACTHQKRAQVISRRWDDYTITITVTVTITITIAIIIIIIIMITIIITIIITITIITTIITTIMPEMTKLASLIQTMSTTVYVVLLKCVLS